MTAISHRDMAGFVRQSILYIAMFAVLTMVAVLYRFTEERLGLFWRVWLTRRIIHRYLADRTYLYLKHSPESENPDQRIAEDVRVFTATTLSFTIVFMNGALAVLSFSGVLWTISPLLFGVAIGYSVIGTVAAIYLGRPLIGLNYRQSDQEAAFRSDLIHVRDNSESVALLRREGRLTTRLLRRIDGFADNFRRITSVNRNLGFFTTGYNNLIQLTSALIVAPLFIRGKVEFGVITQSAAAFAQLLGAFSLIVNQFQAISSFAAVIALQQVINDLQALRGIADISAVTIAAELGSVSRFNSAHQLMGYCGAVPSEDSRGKRTRRGGITKTGNAHLRRIVVEAAWSYRRPPCIWYGLRRRQESIPEEVKEIAWKAQHRLHKRYRKLGAAGKDQRKIATAVARELLGFIWAIGTRAETIAKQQFAA
jgi:ABC-type long-subunit fatty acid transport system fused permease/ATPase subunit